MPFSSTTRTRRRDTFQSPLADKPFRCLQNPWKPMEILTDEQVEQIHNASMHILENIGIDFLDDEALTLWQAAGAKVDRQTQHVWLDRGLITELIAKAPAEFTLRARNPAHNLQIGRHHINFCTVGGAPFYSDLERGRQPGTLAMFQQMVKLAQLCGPIHVVEGLLLEPQDVPVPVRHLEKAYHQFTLCDKAITTAAHGRFITQDYINMAAIVYGGLENIQQTPVFAAVVNANSPLRFDDRMLGGLITYARNGQPPIVTPFILAGAMSPVSIPAAIAQQNAEALAGIALTQLVRPGTPVIYGGFTTNVDMQTGSPAFGTPEGAMALLCGAQLARRYGLPYRGSGGLNNAKTADYQAAFETQMSLWPAVLAHANLIIHSAGWLEAGLVCSLEKFILDIEGLATMHHFLAGLETPPDSFALDAIAEVGSGGHHFGTDHTLAHYRTAFYLPILADRQNYQTWQEHGSQDAMQRAHRLAKQLLEQYEQPKMETAVSDELKAYVEKRKLESGVDIGY